jgi:hypothetical protein
VNVPPLIILALNVPVVILLVSKLGIKSEVNVPPLIILALNVPPVITLVSYFLSSTYFFIFQS